MKAPRANGLEQRGNDLSKAVDWASDPHHRNRAATGVCKQAAGWFGRRHDSVQKRLPADFDSQDKKTFSILAASVHVTQAPGLHLSKERNDEMHDAGFKLQFCLELER